MDQAWLLVGLSGIVLIAYLFDFLGRFIRVPAVVLLLFVGLGMRIGADILGWELVTPDDTLPVLGTFGLILIVLEGALDLRLSRQAAGLIVRSASCALLGILLTGGLMTTAFIWWLDAPLKIAVLHALPLAVISSAVAIPAAVALKPSEKEFVIYESSISDIVGVVLFYALLENSSDVGGMLVRLTGEITLSIVIGLGVGLMIYLLIQRIEHHVRVLPMIFGITLLYGLGKLTHLAPLVMVLLVGLLLNNTALLGKRLQSNGDFEADLNAFKHLTAEFTFAVRAFFFVLLGYSTNPGDLIGRDSWLMAGFVLVCCLVPRWILLRAIGEKGEPLVWFAPRGLVTVLLFLGIPAALNLPGFPRASLMLIILISALLLTAGVIRIRPEEKTSEPEQKPAVVSPSPEPAEELSAATAENPPVQRVTRSETEA